MSELLSINVAQPRMAEYKGRVYETGIYKEQVSEPVMLRVNNLDGDRQADLKNHGGHDKAVYFYTHENYDFWAEELGRNGFPFGQFGENFTVTDMPEARVCLGNIYQIGEAMIQVTQPRLPCFKLENKMGIEGFIDQFRNSTRVGFYARVLQEGLVEAGQTITLYEAHPQHVSVEALMKTVYLDGDRTTATRALKIDILPIYWRKKLHTLIAKA